jgi:hypothetical protein
MNLAPGVYMIRTQRAGICQNSSSGGQGFIRAFGSAAEGPASPPWPSGGGGVGPGPGPGPGGGAAGGGGGGGGAGAIPPGGPCPSPMFTCQAGAWGTGGCYLPGYAQCYAGLICGEGRGTNPCPPGPKGPGGCYTPTFGRCDQGAIVSSGGP